MPYNNTNPSTIETTDHVIVVKNNTVVFDYLEQADIKAPVQIRVIDTPKFGEVHIQEDQTFIYAPSPDLCEEEDQFTYLLTTHDKTVKVHVSIEILCESLTILNGLVNSKKEERLNNFTILGVENFPKNSLYIFDNAGNQIYTMKGYKNDWNGNIDSSKHLILENLYYYVFNDGHGNYFSGYLTKHEMNN